MISDFYSNISGKYTTSWTPFQHALTAMKLGDRHDLGAMACSLAHPLWSIAELVREVMKQATDDQDTLVQCARVSHAFSEPALEMLWAEQRGLGRLLGLLPASFKKITSGGEEETADPETASFVSRLLSTRKNAVLIVRYLSDPLRRHSGRPVGAPRILCKMDPRLYQPGGQRRCPLCRVYHPEA